MDRGNLDGDDGAGLGELFKPKERAVLYVDDEPLSLKNFVKAFGQEFWILTASNAREAMALLHEHAGAVGVLMTDQNMPGEKGLWLLQQARDLDPLVVRILATASCDWSAVLEAMKLGLFCFIPLPWEPEQIPHLLRRALRLHALQRQVMQGQSAGELSSGDFVERLNALRACFRDPELPGTPLALYKVISGEGGKTPSPNREPSPR